MKATLKVMTPDPIKLIYTACRQCYSEKTANEIWDSYDSIPKEKVLSLITDILESGHESVLEHIYFTFFIENAPRSLTHQLVRHRLMSISQQSLRYVQFDDKKIGFTVPHTVIKNKEAKELSDEFIDVVISVYHKMIELGIPREDAREYLPMMTNSSLVITLNIRELLHIISLRCCTRAQKNIRVLSENILDECKKALPEIFSNAGPKCEKLGYCPESEKRACGKKPLKNKIFNDKVPDEPVY